MVIANKERGAMEFNKFVDDGTTAPAVKVIDAIGNSLVPGTYDYIEMSYTGSNMTGVIYKRGGASGTVVATLVLAYTGSNLTSVTKS